MFFLIEFSSACHRLLLSLWLSVAVVAVAVAVAIVALGLTWLIIRLFGRACVGVLVLSVSVSVADSS